MVKLSVLIPSFNHSQFIIETLNSHIEDNPFDYEIIIIDDGSTDNSVEIIQKWIDTKQDIKTTFIHRENRGVTATLNQLVDLASGDFIRMFGSDDISYSKSSALMIDYLEKNDLDACFGYCKVIDEKGLVTADNSIENLGKRVSDYQQDVTKAIISKWAIVGPSLMLRKSVFNVIGRFDEKSLIEDWYLYMNLAAKCKIQFINECVAFYRHHQNNASRTKDRIRKVKNYESQIHSGEMCLKLFETKEYRDMLSVEILKLKIKKNLFKRNIAHFVCCAVQYISKVIIGR